MGSKSYMEIFLKVVREFVSLEEIDTMALNVIVEKGIATFDHPGSVELYVIAFNSMI